MNNYKSFSELKEELGNNYDFKLYEMGISALKEIENLQQENKQLQKRMEYLERSNNRREDIIIEQRQEINNLEDNWDELKEYCKETKLKEFEKSYGKRYGKTFTQAEIIVCNMILDKMQELEKGSDSNVKD